MKFLALGHRMFNVLKVIGLVTNPSSGSDCKNNEAKK